MCHVSHLTCPFWVLAVVLQKATAILGQSLDHLQSGQVLLVMQDALVPMMQPRGHREHVSEATVPRHCRLITGCWLSTRNNSRIPEHGLTQLVKKCLTEVSSSRMSVGYMYELWISVWVDSSCCTPQSSLQAHQLNSRYRSVWLAVLRVNDRVLLSVLLVLFSTRAGREWVKDTVGSGNIWWARQTQKGSLKISRKQERVKIQDRAGYFTLEGQTLVRVEMYYVWGKQYLTALFSVRVR